MTRALPLALALLALGCDKPAPEIDRVDRMVTSADGDIGVVVHAHNAFAWDLYAAVAAGEDDNVFFSPFSVTAAMSMVLAGARGDTEDELAQVLGAVPGEAEDWHGALGELLRDLNGDLGRGYTLNVANRLFGQESYPWEDPFLQICAEDYDAPFQPWDFIADPEGGRLLVNDWVAEQTHDRIQDLLPPGSVTTDTRMVLANAIYFLADWASQFDPDDTRDGAFTLLDGSTVTVPMMSLDTQDLEEHGIQAGWIDGGRLLRMPYQDDEVSMVIVVPDEHDGLPALEAGLDAATFEGWLQSLGGGDTTIEMPRFELQWELELSEALAALGAPSMFSASTADLTGMADVEGEQLFVSGVFHKAFVKVDEQGTEAAAATGAVVGVESAGDWISVDRPFLFVIRDDLTGAILFTGRVLDPS